MKTPILPMKKPILPAPDPEFSFFLSSCFASSRGLFPFPRYCHPDFFDMQRERSAGYVWKKWYSAWPMCLINVYNVYLVSKNDIRDVCSTNDFLPFWLFADAADTADATDVLMLMPFWFCWLSDLIIFYNDNLIVIIFDVWIWFQFPVVFLGKSWVKLIITIYDSFALACKSIFWREKSPCANFAASTFAPANSVSISLYPALSLYVGPGWIGCEHPRC